MASAATPGSKIGGTGCALRESTPDPVKLGCVQGRHLHHGQSDVAPVVDQLTIERVAEALDGMLGGAVGRLEGDAPIRQRRADLDDDASVARPHSFQGGQSAMDGAQVGHLRHSTILLGVHLPDGRKDRDHRVVDPDINRAELGLDRRSGGLHLAGIGDVRWNHEGPPSPGLDVPACAFQPCDASSKQADVRPRSAKARAVARPTPADAPVMTTTSDRPDRCILFQRSSTLVVFPRSTAISPVPSDARRLGGHQIRINASPDSSSISFRKCSGDSVRITSRVGRTCPSIRCPPRVEPSERPTTT